jgi:hypothetical protein
MIIATTDISSDSVSSNALAVTRVTQPNQQDAFAFENIAARQKEKAPKDEVKTRTDDQRESNAPHVDAHSAGDSDSPRIEDGSTQDRLNAAGIALAWQPPASAFASSLAGSVPVATPAEPLSWDMLSSYVDRLLVNSQPNSSGPAAVLTLSEDVLPGTTLSLSRVQDGWVLHAATPNEAVFRQLQAHLAQLRERFERRNLGALNLEVLVEAIS